MKKSSVVNKAMILTLTALAVGVFSFSQANALYTYHDENVSINFHTFEASEYRVRFYTGYNGTSWDTYTDVNIESGDTITVGNVPSPSLSGYTFQGWVTEIPSNSNYNSVISPSTVANTTVTGELNYYPILKSNDKKVYSMVNSVGTYYSLNTDVTINYSSIGSTSLGYRYVGIEGLPGGSVKFNDYDLLTTSGQYQFVESGDDLILNRKIGLKISDTESNYWFKETTEKYALHYYKDDVGSGWTSVVSRSRGGGTFRHDFYIQAWYPKIIFVRINNATNTGSWDNKWNQSGDISLTGGYSATNYINSKNVDWWDTWEGTWVAS